MICQNCGKELFVMGDDQLSECPFCLKHLAPVIDSETQIEGNVLWIPDTPAAIGKGRISERYLSTSLKAQDLRMEGLSVLVTDQVVKLFNPKVEIAIPVSEIEDVQLYDGLFFLGPKIYVKEGDPVLFTFGRIGDLKALNVEAVDKIKEACEPPDVRLARAERERQSRMAAAKEDERWFDASETKRLYEKYIKERPVLLQEMTMLSSMLIASAAVHHKDQAFWDNRTGALAAFSSLANTIGGAKEEFDIKKRMAELQNEISTRTVFIEKYERLQEQKPDMVDADGKVCSRCGSSIGPEDKFCRECGAVIN